MPLPLTPIQHACWLEEPILLVMAALPVTMLFEWDKRR